MLRGGVVAEYPLAGADRGADGGRRPVVLRPHRADQGLGSLAAVQIAVVDPLRQRPQLGHGFRYNGRDGLQRELEGEAGGVLCDRPAEGDQLVGVDEGESAREGIDAAAAGPEARQVHRRDLLRAHGSADIEVAEGPVARRLALERRRAGGVDRRAAPEVRHFGEDTGMGRSRAEQCDRQCRAHRAFSRINSHGQAPGR